MAGLGAHDVQAAGRDPETPWLLCSKACEGLMAT